MTRFSHLLSSSPSKQTGSSLSAAGIWRDLWPYLLVGAVIVARDYTAIYRAEFWAEDADEFFVAGLNSGIRSIVIPIMGYQFFIPRVIAYLTCKFTIVHAPLGFALGALLLNVVTAGYFSRPGFSWLIAGRYARILVCVLVALGSSEVYLNLINLPTPMTFLALLILLEQPWALSKRKSVVLLLMALSAGPMLFLLPIILYLWYTTGNARYLWLSGILAALAAINITGGVAAAQNAGLFTAEYHVIIPRVLVEQAFIRLFLLPFLGPQLTGQLMSSPNFVFWPMVLGICIAIWKTSLHKYIPLVLVIAYVLVIAPFGAIAVARNYAIPMIQRQFGMTLAGMRYAYLPAQVALVIWFVVFCRMIQTGIRRRVAYIGMFLVTIWTLSQWTNVYRRSDLHWKEAAARIEEGLRLSDRGLLHDPLTIIMQIHPSYYHHARMALVIDPGGMVKALAEDRESGK